MTLLTRLDDLPATVLRPRYDRAALRAGILHLGPGAFLRAHLAAYTDTALEHGGAWGIETAGLRNSETADILNAQNGLYTLLVRDTGNTQARVIGAVLRGVAPGDILLRMADPAIRIVSLTITEKAYGLNAATGGLDAAHPAIAADLAAPHAPQSAVGLVSAALGLRRAAGRAPFTPLSCDNLPANGAVLRRLVLEYTARHDPGLAAWIGDNVPFPSTMVDRITPASTDATYTDAARLTGHEDRAAVETEPFTQWVIEDRFASGRPAWERAGALLVADVTPFEKMKLRMLNGTHSLMAWLGFMAGHEYIRDAIADPVIAQAARAHLRVAASTLGPVPGVNPEHYAQDLLDRFANRAIAHRTAQIAMDGTQKLPPRVFEPATELLARGADADSYALITAAWMHYAGGICARDGRHPLQDPREAEIRAALAAAPPQPAGIAAALFALPGLFPAALLNNEKWRGAVTTHLAKLMA
ncbi:mannitol dehydrogenase family protein [Pararhodobacter sp.]|uniref:mannitol dehydrogenase family protein n=1 Tax=Pararhodobacter sp. TaxID=2127056 RepID=UPI002FDC7E76